MDDIIEAWWIVNGMPVVLENRRLARFVRRMRKSRAHTAVGDIGGTSVDLLDSE